MYKMNLLPQFRLGLIGYRVSPQVKAPRGYGFPAVGPVRHIEKNTGSKLKPNGLGEELFRHIPDLVRG